MEVNRTRFGTPGYNSKAHGVQRFQFRSQLCHFLVVNVNNIFYFYEPWLYYLYSGNTNLPYYSKSFVRIRWVNGM